MRRSLARLASAATPHALAPAAASALLPPIPLYRRLLRAHRKHLPADMRVLGDEYIKAEFRAHRTVDNPAHLIGFLAEWQLYAQKIEGDSWVGDMIDPGKLAKLSGELSAPIRAFVRPADASGKDEQVHQLYELMQAIKSREEDGEPQ